MRYTTYQKQLQRQQGRRNPRDSNRRNDYDEDFERLTKMHSTSRRTALINASQIGHQCDNINEFATQGLAKLFMAQAVHEKQ